METIFPTSTGYASFFAVSVRRGSTGIEQTGTAVLKGTYDIDANSGGLTLSDTPLGVFMQDQVDNLVANSDFKTADGEGAPGDWEAEAGVMAQVITDPLDEENQLLQVMGSGRITQTIAVSEPLDGRQFWLSLTARSNVAGVSLAGVQLEAEGHTICQINATLTPADQRLAAGGTWPAGLEATEMTVVLQGVGHTPPQPIYQISYDDIQVEERGYATTWDDNSVLFYEHDLAAYKPMGDVIVLGFARTLGWNRVRVNGVNWYGRLLTDVTPPEKSLFGWEPRMDSVREAEAGTFDPLPEEALPHDFNNQYYNGYRRDAQETAARAYLPANALIEIVQNEAVTYRFRLPDDTVRASYVVTANGGQRTYPVAMNIDTLVIEPEANRCYIVWRGVWNFEAHTADSYQRLTVEVQ